MLTAENGSSTSLCIASCPCDGRNLQFILDRRPNDAFSDLAFSGNLAKQTVLIEGPSGDFLLQEDSMAPALFMAKGAGFAPIKSLVEQAITIDNAEGLHLIQVGGNTPGSSLDNLCRSWNDSLDNFVYSATDTDASDEDLVEILSVAISGTPQVDVYLAGPHAWLKPLLKAATGRGLDTASWHHWSIG